MANRKTPNRKEIEGVLKLPGPKRYSHSIKVAAGWEEVWGLYNDGWAMAGTDEGELVFPIWPAKEYAEQCAMNEWGNYTPESIPLDDLLEVLLPKLEEDGVLPGVFYTPMDKGVIPSIDQLIEDLRAECERYE